MTKVAIQLPDELNQFVNATVQAGDFHNADEFFVSVVSMYKDRVETQLNEIETAKLVSLRSDIQIALEQAERGEVIRDFKMDEFLAERHRQHAALQNA